MDLCPPIIERGHFLGDTNTCTAFFDFLKNRVGTNQSHKVIA